MSHIKNLPTGPDNLSDPVYVVTTVFNPIRFNSRWRLYNKFAHHVTTSGGILYTVEVALGDREFSVTTSNNPCHLQLRSREIIWHKERALNLLIHRLPANWKYLAWVDADVTFVRTDWINEIRHQLQVYDILQPWKIAEDLDALEHPIQRHMSFGASFANRIRTPKQATGNYEGSVILSSSAGDMQAWHPGFAWAIRRDAFDKIGALFDTGICGAGDNHMAKALVGDAANSCHPQVSEGYRSAVLEWGERAAMLYRNIGYMDGLLLHHWHGPKAGRRYWDRWKILTETKFDPSKDLIREATGLFGLKPQRYELKRLLREYFLQRNEDAPY